MVVTGMLSSTVDSGGRRVRCTTVCCGVGPAECGTLNSTGADESPSSPQRMKAARCDATAEVPAARMAAIN